MLPEIDLKIFKEETHRACVAAGGLRLREWIHRKENPTQLNSRECCCPLLARTRFLQLGNAALSPTQFWTFADGFDNDGPYGNPLPGHDFHSLGQEFRNKVLAGEYDNS